MSAKCFPLVGGSAMRVTRTDACGRPVYGDCSQVVSDGFVSISVTANIEEGDEISVQNANGKTCVRQTPCPQLTGYSLEIAFCDVDPDLFALITSQAQVLDTNGDAVGFRVNTAVSGCDSGFALEVWSNVPGVACSDDASSEGTFGYLLFPFLQGGVFGDFTIENDAVSFTITGATTKSGTAWGVGPYDVVLDGSTPGPLLEPLLSDDHLHVQLTEVAPPEVTCGCKPLDDPGGLPATEAVAGTPGTWTPTGSNRPDDLADLQASAVVANPTTAWTSGQYVRTEDGHEQSWDGTGWIAGRAGAA